MEHNRQKLEKHILSLSESNNFYKARSEWSLVDIKLRLDWDNCPCGQSIKELCYIENAYNSNRTYVGNVCINQFMGIDTGNLFDGLKRIADDEYANANHDLIKHAYELGYIYENEYKFLMDTRHKRKLSDKQLEWKRKINHRIIHKTIVRKAN